MSSQEQLTVPGPGVSVGIEEPTGASVAGVTPAPQVDARKGLGVGLMALLVFTVTILAAIGDTAVNGSITALTGILFVGICVVAAVTIDYRDLSTAIITAPLAYFTAILVAGQAMILSGSTDNLLIREAAMVLSGLAYSAPWIFAGTGAATLIVIVRRFLLHR